MQNRKRTNDDVGLKNRYGWVYRRFDETFEYNAQKRCIDFKFMHEDTKLNAWIDISNFDKVMMNVLSNAQFTPDNGAITVSLKSVHNAKATS